MVLLPPALLRQVPASERMVSALVLVLVLGDAQSILGRLVFLILWS